MNRLAKASIKKDATSSLGRLDLCKNGQNRPESFEDDSRSNLQAKFTFHAAFQLNMRATCLHVVKAVD